MIRYKNELYTANMRISAAMTASDTPAKQVIETLKKEGRKGLYVLVVNKNLKGKTDLHGNPYQASKWIYTNDEPNRLTDDGMNSRNFGAPIRSAKVLTNK